MNTPTIMVDASPQADYRLPVVQKLFTDVSTGNNNHHHANSISEVLKEYSHRFDHDLAVKVRVPLGHISLAAEMLESLSSDNDLKMCLNVIARNSTRINSLVNEFHSFLQVEEVKAERRTFTKTILRYA